MKVGDVHSTRKQGSPRSEAAEGKSGEPKAPINFGAAKRGGTRRLFAPRGDIIDRTVASDSGGKRAILRMLSNCY